MKPVEIKAVEIDEAPNVGGPLRRLVTFDPIYHTRRSGWQFAFELKLADFWVGAYWKRSALGSFRLLDVWICLIPCVPFHVRRVRTVPGMRLG